MIGTKKVPNRVHMVEAYIPVWPHPIKTWPRTIRINDVKTFRFSDPGLLPDFDKEGFIGIKVRAIFNHRYLPLFLDTGEVGVYLGDLVEACQYQKKPDLAEELLKPEADEKTLIIFPFGTYQYVKSSH